MLQSAFAQTPPVAFEMQNNLSPNKVYGQSNFTTNSSGASQTAMNNPYQTAIDHTTGKVFICDLGNNRILRYASIDRYQNGESAEIVLGQTNFTSTGSAVARNRFDEPTGIFVDGSGTLWVADWGNNRVLKFNNASTKSTGANADGVLGQSNYTNRSSNRGGSANAGTMSSPVAVHVESDGTLWVGDTNNSRILRFNNASSKSNGANANGVLGQTNFSNRFTGIGANRVFWVGGLTVDNTGRLYITDIGNNRVLWWNNAASKSNGANADGLLGQSNYSNSGSGLARNKFSGPRMLGVDPKGRFLSVSDPLNNRVMIFLRPGSAYGLLDADYVLGQSNFTSGSANSGGLSASSTYNPRGSYMYQTADYETYFYNADRGNNRMKLFSLFGEFDTDSNTPVTDNLSGTDVDGDILTYSIVNTTSNGNFTIDNINSGAYTYTPIAALSTYTDTLTYRVCDSDGCDTSVVYFNVETYPIIWNGTSWSNGLSSSVSGGPSNNPQDAVKTMIIQAGAEAHITESIEVRDIQMEANTSMTVDPGNCMTVSNSVSIDATASVTLASNSETAYAQYIGPAMANTTVEMTLADYGWHQIASPITGKTLGDLEVETSTGSEGKLVYAATPDVPFGDTSHIRWYETQDYQIEDIGFGKDENYSHAYGTWYGGMSTDAFDGTRGYFIFVNSTLAGDQPLPVKLKITGTTIASSKQTNTDIDNFGWNLVSNPYPTSLDWEAIEEREGLSGSLTNPVRPTVSIWEPANQNYATYLAENGSGTSGTSANNYGTGVDISAGSRYIAPFQSFWVQRDDFEIQDQGLSTPSDFTILPSDRASCESPKHFKVAQEQQTARIRLSSKSNPYTDELVVNFRDDYTPSFDPKKDAYKLKSDNEDVAMIMTRRKDRNLVIHGTSMEKGQAVVPLWTEAKVGESLRLEITELPEGLYAWLEDAYSGDFYAITKKSFRFTNFKPNSEHRYNLVFTRENKPPNASKAKVYTTELGLKIDFEIPESNKEIRLIDMLGRIVYQKKLSHNEEQLDIVLDNKGKQAYILHIITKNDAKVEKLVF